MTKYETTEECLKVNGEHAWVKNESKGISCLVYHADGYCSWNDPSYNCYHCPAKKTYTRIQAPQYQWVDEKGESIKMEFIGTTLGNIGGLVKGGGGTTLNTNSLNNQGI